MLTRFRRQIVLLTLAAMSSDLYVAAATQPVIGKIVRSSGASLGGVAIPNEGTIIAGDTLSTVKGGNALVKFSGGSQASLLEETTVSFSRNQGCVSAQMSSGILAANSTGTDVLFVETPKYKIEPAEQGNATFVVAMLPDKTTLVSAGRGKVSVIQTISGQKYVLLEGRYAKLSDYPSDSPAQGNARGGPPKLLTSPAPAFIIAVGVGVGIAVVLDKTILAPAPASASRPAP